MKSKKLLMALALTAIGASFIQTGRELVVKADVYKEVEGAYEVTNVALGKSVKFTLADGTEVPASYFRSFGCIHGNDVQHTGSRTSAGILSSL